MTNFSQDLITSEIILDDKVTFIIKTCYRPKLAERLFLSIRKYYPNIKVIICDDGQPKMNQELFDNNTKYIDTYVDVGLSKGRNILVENVQTEYLLLLDDDFVFYEETNIELLFNQFLKHQYDILSAQMLDFYDYESFKNMSYKIREFKGIISKEENNLYVTNNKLNSYNCYDFTINFFICKTQLLLENKWDDELKLLEHLEFFYRLKNKNPNIRIQNCNQVKIYHIRDHKYSQLYNKIRYDLDDYSKLLHNKMEVDKIYLNNKEFKG